MKNIVLSIIGMILAISGLTVSGTPASADRMEPGVERTGQVRPDGTTSERGRRFVRVTNQYGGYDEFDVYAAGPRFNGVNTWRTAIITSYKSYNRKVRGGKIGVEFRHISSRDTSNKCKSIRDFTANLSVLGFNPGSATTDCNGQDSRFITWFPADAWVIRKSTSDGFRDISGAWTVDIAGRSDQGSDYDRVYPRFRR